MSQSTSSSSTSAMKGWRPTTEAAARKRISHLGEAPMGGVGVRALPDVWCCDGGLRFHPSIPKLYLRFYESSLTRIQSPGIIGSEVIGGVEGLLLRCHEFAIGLRIVSQRVCLKLLAVSKIEADSAIKFTAKPRT